MTTQPELPSGFTCECGQTHEYSGYVYAHWDTPLVHTCPECERQHTILRGRAMWTGLPKDQDE
jgi:hypothetical protein